jgi:hypothetical protein
MGSSWSAAKAAKSVAWDMFQNRENATIEQAARYGVTNLNNAL